jgi:phosphoribosylamine---glycine ligase
LGLAQCEEKWSKWEEKNLRVLVIGSGGREHALVWKCKQSPQVTEVFCAPGNGGIEQVATCVNINVTDQAELLQFAQQMEIDLTVVGPEVPLTEGIVDRFQAAGLKVFGPSQQAAQLEGSKRFAKQLMEKYQIPTAAYQSFTDAAAAKAYIHEQGAPIVIKADGLAAGKGVIVARTEEEALEAISQVMETQVFGAAGAEVVIEEFLLGQEISLMAFVDRHSFKPMVVSQDHKPVFDSDQGPNTGGMGAYSPVPQIPDEMVQRAIDEILVPMTAALREEKLDYRGVLYAGLMITTEGPKVIEFNARFGDPETQVVLPRLETDLVDIMLAVVEDRLQEQEIRWSDEAAVCVVMAAGGYPDRYQTGDAISRLPEPTAKKIVFHAGTKQTDGQIVSNGGRVLGVTAVAADLAQAREEVYQLVTQIELPGVHYRTDIGQKGLV